MKNSTTAEREKSLNQFLDWLNIKFPGSKRKILSRANLKVTFLAGLGQGEEFEGPPSFLMEQPAETNWFADTFDKVIEATASIIPAYTNYELQKSAYEIQLERAKTGQAPLDLSKYGTMPIRVEHGVDYRTAIPPMTEDTKNTLMIGGGIILALFLMGRQDA